MRPRWKFWKSDSTIESYEFTTPGCWTKEQVIASVKRNLKENQYPVITFKGGIKEGICYEEE